jgi:hypothetical protein
MSAIRLPIVPSATVAITAGDQNSLFAEYAKLANDSEAIPIGEALDRLLRAQTANERNLKLANDNLEFHQRQRKGKLFLLN